MKPKAKTEVNFIHRPEDNEVELYTIPVGSYFLYKGTVYFLAQDNEDGTLECVYLGEGTYIKRMNSFGGEITVRPINRVTITIEY
jgi:hypothetical protein